MTAKQQDSPEIFLKEHILVLFNLPDGDLIWQGESELDIERFLYYFRIEDTDYVLVNELRHDGNIHKLTSSINSNALPPHKKALSIYPKEGTYVHSPCKDGESTSYKTGDFSLFEIIDR